MPLFDLTLAPSSSTTLLTAQVHPLLIIPLAGAAGVEGIRRYVIRLWAKLEDLMAWLKKLLAEVKNNIDDAVNALLLKFSAPYEQDLWCIHLEADSPAILQKLLDKAKTNLKLLDLKWLAIKKENFPSWYTKALEFKEQVDLFELQCNDLSERVLTSSTRITASIHLEIDPNSENTMRTLSGSPQPATSAQGQLGSEKPSSRESKFISDMRNLWAGAVKRGQFYRSVSRLSQDVD